MDKKFTALAFERASKTDSYAKGDFHQAVLDIAYDEWQTHDEWSYGDMVDNARGAFGELAAALVLAGKYNQQVCNGGHSQYFCNGYANGSGGCFSDHSADIPLHREMTGMFERVIVPLADGEKAVHAALGIMKRFRVRIDVNRTTREQCESCYGSGQDDDGKMCGTCGGDGEYDVENNDYGSVINDGLLDALDDEWYEIEDAVMAALNGVACRAFSEYDQHAAGMLEASEFAEAESKMCAEDGERIAPATFKTHGTAANDTYVSIMECACRYDVLERVTGTAGETVGYSRNKPNHVRRDLYRRVRAMKRDEFLDYWKDVADAYDVPTDDGVRDDIREAYDAEINNLIECGYIVPQIDENGITVGYVRTDK